MELNLVHHVHCFGVGDGMACADRDHSSYLYRLGKETVLLDCGEPVSRHFQGSGLAADCIDRIILSHLHFDHVGGLFMLLQGLWLEKRRRDLTIHLPADGVAPIKAMLEAGTLFPELLGFAIHFIPLEAGSVIEAGAARLTPFRSTHLATLEERFRGQYPQRFQAFCFLIESKGKRIGHSADIGAPSDLDPMFERPLDLLICELAHFQPEEICAYLQEKPVSRIAFVHIGRWYWERFEETRRRMIELLPGREILFPSGGETLPL